MRKISNAFTKIPPVGSTGQRKTQQDSFLTEMGRSCVKGFLFPVKANDGFYLFANETQSDI